MFNLLWFVVVVVQDDDDEKKTTTTVLYVCVIDATIYTANRPTNQSTKQNVVLCVHDDFDSDACGRNGFFSLIIFFSFFFGLMTTILHTFRMWCTNKVKMPYSYVFIDLSSLYEVDLSIHTHMYLVDAAVAAAVIVDDVACARVSLYLFHNDAYVLVNWSAFSV